jgi:CHAT domain-containing protein
VHEILDLELPASVVVLSACNTGLGPVANGEGVIGLTRAFLHAGARAVLVSLWEVPDASTADLMAAFYAAHRGAGLPLDVALQRAQLAHLASGGRPAEWAPFVVTGAVTAAPPAAGRTGLLAAGCALAAVGIVAGIVLRRRARHPASLSGVSS